MQDFVHQQYGQRTRTTRKIPAQPLRRSRVTRLCNIAQLIHGHSGLLQSTLYMVPISGGLQDRPLYSTAPIPHATWLQNEMFRMKSGFVRQLALACEVCGCRRHRPNCDSDTPAPVKAKPHAMRMRRAIRNLGHWRQASQPPGVA